MARLRNPSNGRVISLAAHTVVGSRRATSLLWIKDPYVSGVHAQLRFSTGRWYLQDKGSSNGTWVNDRRVCSATTVQLQAGDRIIFGPKDHDAWELEDETCPPVFVLDSVTREQHLARDGRIVLPDGRVLLIHENHATILGNVAQVLEDGQLLPGGGLQLYLPSDANTRLEELRFSLDQLVLDVEFAGDTAGVTLRQDGQELHLGRRSPWRLLFFLAEQRSSDPDDLGWMDIESLKDQSGAAKGTLDAWTHHIRKEMSLLGVEGWRRIVEATERHGRRVGISRDRLVVRG